MLNCREVHPVIASPLVNRVQITKLKFKKTLKLLGNPI